MKKLYLIFLLLGWLPARAQLTLHSVSKTTKKEFTGVQTLTIEADRADILLEPTDNEAIQVEIRLTMRHPQRATAEQELAFAKAITLFQRKDVFLRNILEVPANVQQLESNFRAMYHIKLPAQVAVSIKNSFGKITAKMPLTRLKLNGNFCQTSLPGVTTQGNFEGQFGDWKLGELTGVQQFKLNRTDLAIQQVGGNTTITNQYGSVAIYALGAIQNLQIKGDRTLIKLEGVDWKSQNFRLQNAYGKFSLPAGFQISGPVSLQEATYTARKGTPIQIQTSFNTLSIR